jgi:hypothetical protein
MDYIGQILARQQRLLSALTGERTEAEAAEDLPARPSAAPAKSDPAEEKAAAGTPEAETARLEILGRALQSRSRERLRHFLPESGEAGGTRAAAAYAAAEAEGETEERTLEDAGRFPAGTGESAARELSRAYERDARRYDGGFSLY